MNMRLFWQSTLRAFRHQHLSIIAIDLGFLAALYLCIFGISLVFSADPLVIFMQSNTVETMGIQDIPADFTSQYYWFWGKFLVFLTLFIGVCITGFIFTQTIIWNIILARKRKLEHLKRFFLGSLAWIPVFITMVVITGAASLLIQLFIPPNTLYSALAGVLFLIMILFFIIITLTYQHGLIKHGAIIHAFTDIKVALKMAHYLFMGSAGIVILISLLYNLVLLILSQYETQIIVSITMVFVIITNLAILSILRAFIAEMFISPKKIHLK